VDRHRRGPLIRAAVILCALVLGLAGCAAAEGDPVDAPVAVDVPDPGPQSSPDQGEDGGAVEDGEADPVQQTRRSGIATNFGGPAHGDQGTVDQGDGTWCQGVALFWGAQVPEGVRFTVDGVAADAEGIALGRGACGDVGTDGACIGLVLWHDDQTLFCSVPLIPADGFTNGTQLALLGTLECETASDCDAVIAREVEAGPPIFVCDPVFVAEGNACDATARESG
jgi:hypothetical protein